MRLINLHIMQNYSVINAIFTSIHPNIRYIQSNLEKVKIFSVQNRYLNFLNFSADHLIYVLKL